MRAHIRDPPKMRKHRGRPPVFLATQTPVETCKLMIRIKPIAPQRDNNPPAQSSALGMDRVRRSPERAKEFLLRKQWRSDSFALTGRGLHTPTLPKAMSWPVSLLAFQAVYQVHADNHFCEN